MDYETGDGSQFSLREIWSGDSGTPQFQATLITAFVDGNAYVGKSSQRANEMEDVDVIQYLERVPPENIFPALPEGFKSAPEFDMSGHYLKAPQFTYEDREPGQTFVAECVLAEASVLERLSRQPHPSIVTYYGCVTKENRITHLCLKRCYCTLAEYHHIGLSVEEKMKLLQQIREGIKHLHSMGLAHNDINPDNICVDAHGHAVIVDFDSCVRFGETLKKGISWSTDGKSPTSNAENDLRGLEDVESFLLAPATTPRAEYAAEIDSTRL